MGEAEDTFKALTKAESAFFASLETDGWDFPLELTLSARQLDVEGRTIRRIMLDNVEKPSEGDL